MHFKNLTIILEWRIFGGVLQVMEVYAGMLPREIIRSSGIRIESETLSKISDS
jgi:hypothetical protein